MAICCRQLMRKVLFHLLVLSSACTNPVLYGWLNENFVKSLLMFSAHPAAIVFGHYVVVDPAIRAVPLIHRIVQLQLYYTQKLITESQIHSLRWMVAWNSKLLISYTHQHLICTHLMRRLIHHSKYYIVNSFICTFLRWSNYYFFSRNTDIIIHLECTCTQK